MTLHRPNFSMPPPPLLPTARRVQAIFEHQVLEQAGWVNLALLALTFLVVDLQLVFLLYLGHLIPAGGFGGATLTTFDSPLASGVWYILLILLVTSVGAGSISRDVATKAMTLYLARPIRPIDYLVGKAGAVAFWILVGGVVPGWIGTTIVLAVGFISLPLALQAAGAFLVVGIFSVAAFTGLAVFLSSLSARSTLAGAAIFGVLVGSQAVLSVAQGVSDRSAFLYGSPVADVLGVGAGVFGASGNGLNPWIAGAILLGVAAATFGLAYLRLARGQEIAE